jgi:CHASE2 domain-containing sensor protein
VKFNAVTQHRFFKPAVGAGLAVLCGLVLWGSALGERWADASYDYIFRFSAREVTNQVALILMDNEAYGYYTNEARGQPWSRALHADLLNKLADDGCALVVLDTYFRISREMASDEALATALRRQRGVVLMADLAESEHRKPGQYLDSARPILPAEPFLSAAMTNWGVARLDAGLDGIVRRHWPFPSPDLSYPSLPWTAAQLAGARLSEAPRERWLRYYGESAQWTSLSYHFAMGQATNHFRDQIVFIGSKPESPAPDDEKDEFRTPYTRWTGESMGGVEIQAAAFLNLLNEEWLRRPAGWVEGLIFIVTGGLLGGLLCRMRPLVALGIAGGASLAVTLGAVSWSHFTNVWFPWLIIAGAQVPCALAWALVVAVVRSQPQTILEPLTPINIVPDVPDYDLIHPPFGHGAYGRVWLARNAVGQWQALKAVYRDSFGKSAEPFEREFRGIERYKPISDKHPGLLRVDFVSRPKPEGYFYYVMELGDANSAGWEENPTLYRPRDLASVRAQAERGRLPALECVRIAIPLAEALDFLHRQDLTHRDIKPQNIVFVNGRPKLADVGLVADIKPFEKDHTYLGTPGYMPPMPESPGTTQADIYGLGMVLYVISTGRDPALFPELSATLVEATDSADFIRLNAIILKACQPDRALRFASAAEMAEALRVAEELMGSTRST